MVTEPVCKLLNLQYKGELFHHEMDLPGMKAEGRQVKSELQIC